MKINLKKMLFFARNGFLIVRLVEHDMKTKGPSCVITFLYKIKKTGIC